MRACLALAVPALVGSPWDTGSRWLDAAVVMTVFAVGSVLFGRFEAHKPRGRRVTKMAVVLAITLGVAEVAGRSAAYALFAVPLAAAAWLHLVVLPRLGISGWTAEPRRRYQALLRLHSRRRR